MGSGFGCAPQVRLEVCRQAVRLVWRGEDGIANSEVEGKFAINLPGITNVDLVVAPVHIVEDVCRDFAQTVICITSDEGIGHGDASNHTGSLSQVDVGVYRVRAQTLRTSSAVVFEFLVEAKEYPDLNRV